MEEDIVRNNRYGNAKDYEYGIVKEYGLYKYDKPSFAAIEYSESGEVIYEDYSALDKYIDEKFLTKHLNKNNDLLFVSLHDLLRIHLSEIELTHVFNYLNDKNIFVNGVNTTLAGVFPNYIHRIKNNLYSLEGFTEEDNSRLMVKYYTSKDPKIREEIIVGNIRLANIYAYKYSMYYKLDINELKSYAYEGLIQAVDKFDITKASHVTSYIINYIQGNILNGIKEIYSIPRASYNFGIIKEKLMLEKEEGKSLDEELANVLKENIVNKGIVISDECTKYIDEVIGIYFMKISLDEIDDIIDYSESDIEIRKQEVIKSLLNKLNDKEKKVLVLRYGLLGSERKTLMECGELFNLSKTMISILQKSAIDKIKTWYLGFLEEELYEIENVEKRVLK